MALLGLFLPFMWALFLHPIVKGNRGRRTMRILTILKNVNILGCLAVLVFLSYPSFSQASDSLNPGHENSELKPQAGNVEKKDENSSRESNSDLKSVRSTINEGASKIIKSLGCLAEENHQFDLMVDEWGKKIFELGPKPKMINKKTRYSSFLRFVAWDYLKSDQVCASTSNVCYQKLYRSVDDLFAFFRENDITQPESKKKLDQLKLELKEKVQYIKNLNYSKPSCGLVKSEKEKPREHQKRKEEIEINPFKLDNSEEKEMIADVLPSRQRVISKGHSPKTNEVKTFSAGSSESSSDHEIEAYRKAFLAKGADPVGVENTLKFFENHRDRFKNQRYISLIDATKKSINEPYFLLDTKTLKVKRYDVSFGRGTVASRGGLPVDFSRANVSGSFQTPPGALLVGGSARGNSHSRITYLHGLEDRNKATFSRSVVMHDAPYVHSGGRSHGCPALDPKDFNRIQPLISGGSLLYIYSPFADKYSSGTRSI